MIYFITQQDRFVKIGYTENDVPARLSSLQTGNPFPLQVVKVIEGTQADERDIHVRFNDVHITGEWFYLTKQVLDYIGSVKPCKDSMGDMRQEVNKLDELRDQYQARVSRIDKTELFNLLDKLVDRFT